MRNLFGYLLAINLKLKTHVAGKKSGQSVMIHDTDMEIKKYCIVIVLQCIGISSSVISIIRKRVTLYITEQDTACKPKLSQHPRSAMLQQH